MGWKESLRNRLKEGRDWFENDSGGLSTIFHLTTEIV